MKVAVSLLLAVSLIRPTSVSVPRRHCTLFHDFVGPAQRGGDLERVVVVTIDILVRSGQSVHRFHSLLFAQEDRSIPPPMRADDPTLDDVSLLMFRDSVFSFRVVHH